jgi:pyruvate, water dikinase
VKFADLFRRKHGNDAERMRARFTGFRHLLKMNNQVLRLIADANEMLSGEYLFDAQYLRTLESGLGDAVAAVVRDLAELSGNRYPGLLLAFERVRAAVRASLEPQLSGRAGPLTLNIDELGTELADVAGEKMARLGEIRGRLALPIPDGFVITARACEQAFADPSIAAELERYREGQADSAARLQTAITTRDVPAEVEKAVKEALGRFSHNAKFAVRSSALGEDGQHSFAGQHATFLNVPRDGVLDAWRKVVASLFSARAIEYRRQHGLASPANDMAVGCMLMVPAAASGVVYTVDPNAPQNGTLIVSATYGLGVPVVEGRGEADLIALSRVTPHGAVAREIADKRTMRVAGPDEGTKLAVLPSERWRAPVLDDDALVLLAKASLRVEQHMRCPQDIEWALGNDGTIVLLQARPLRLGPAARPRAEDVLTACKRHRILLRGRGEVACRGVGIGPVFVAASDDATDAFSPGSVLVAHYASPRLSALVAGASALISEVGSVAGHLATVAREFRVPAILGAKGAMRDLPEGMVITVDADENTVYEGNVEALLRYQLLRSQPYEESPTFRALRRMLRSISPLNLRDPGSSSFAPEHCRTYHDIIRFAHERALVEFASLNGIDIHSQRTSARTLDLDIPLDLIVIDLGGGVAAGARGRTLAPNQISSRPLAVLLEGLLAPGAWSMNPADMDLEGFMASATRANPLTMAGSAAVKLNTAIVSANYLNLNLRLGYHFNVVDCYLGENPEDSYIFFRFIGGVTEVVRRARRARLLAAILTRQDFKTDLAGELVIGRLQGVPQAVCEERLRMIGRLIGFSRQLDITLRDDHVADRLVDAFLQGRYQVVPEIPAKENSNAVEH